MRNKIVLALLPTLLGAAAVAAWSGARPAPRSQPAAAPLSCRFTAGEELSYSLAETVDGTPTMQATLHLRVLRKNDPRAYLLAAAMTGLPGDAGPPGPFLVLVQDDCHFADLGFVPATPAAARRTATALLQRLEVLLPAGQPSPDDTPAGWNRAQRDLHGTYWAAYQTEGRDPAGHLLLRRTRGPYGGGAAPAGVTLRVQEDTHLRLDRDGRWLRGLEQDTRVRLAQEQGAVQDLHSRLSLQRLDPGRPFPAAVPDVHQFVFGLPLSGAGPVRFAAAPAAPAAADEGTAPPFRDALAAFAARQAQGDAHADRVAVEGLVRQLRQRPADAGELLQAIRHGQVARPARAPAFLALELAGTPQAEATLEAALSDRDLPVGDRLRAAAALPGVPRPGAGVLAVLSATATARASDGDEGRVGAGALLALGSLSHRSGNPPGVSEAVRAILQEQLHAAPDPTAVTDTLDAIGNSGDPALLPEVMPFLRDAAASIRARAARALRRMGRPAQEALLDVLRHDPDADVRRSAGETLLALVHATGAPPSPLLVEAIRGQLEHEPGAQVRAALVRILGEASATVPAAKQALFVHFRREPEPELLRLLGHFVTAAELGGAP